MSQWVILNRSRSSDRRLRINLGFTGDLSVMDGYAISPELSIDSGQVLRLRSAVANVDTPSTGTDINLTMDYSTDGGGTWTAILSAALVIPTGERQMTVPHTGFFGDPGYSDLPARCLVRGNITQVGSGTVGADLKMQLVGDVVG